MGDIVGHGALADLQLEDVVAAQVEHPLGLFDVLVGVAAGERPGDRQLVPVASAQQFGDRQADALAHGVQQRRFDRRLGEMIADDDLPDRRHGLADPGGIADLQDRREVGVDRELDALRAFLAVAQAADRRAFADADDTVRAMDANDHDGLAVHRRHRENMRPNGRKIDQKGLDLIDLQHYFGAP